MLLELKSRFDGDVRLVERTIDVLKGYAGPVAVMSFDAGFDRGHPACGAQFEARDRQ